VTPILTTENLHKIYNNNRVDALHVLKGIDLEVNEGEIIAVVGPSGVGKSTLLHCIGILDRPNDGRVWIDGRDVYQANDDELAGLRNRTVGFVYQAHHLLPEFTALENVMMPGLIAGVDQNTLRTTAENLLKEINLQDRATHRPSELSGGEQQRIAVARALVNSPRLLLADEPSGNLDTQSANSLHHLLWQLSRQHRQTLIIVTHNLELAAQADRIVELYDGKIKSTHSNRR